MFNAYTETSLRFDPELCNKCNMCTVVCPHGVFERKNGQIDMKSPQKCMECGACQLNCATGAISVESGVGCAAAMIYAALSGKKEPTCGCDSSCCG